jgi:hypothetical protein
MGRHKGLDREIWWVNKKGYIEGRVFRNGVCRQVKQARWIMEQYLRRKLSPTEIVHHSNEDRQDNRIENLEIKTHGGHSRHHNLSRIYPKGRKNNISPKERQRRSDFMKEVHRRRQENDPTNKWYARTKV